MLVEVRKAQPAGTYIVPALSNISIAAMPDDTDYFASQVFPTVPVELQSAYYWTWEPGALLRLSARKRTDQQESAGSGFEFTQAGPYNCDVYALHVDVPRRQAKNMDKALDLDKSITLYLTQQLKQTREADFAEKFMKAGANLWSTEIAPTGNKAWNQGGSDPIRDLRNLIYGISGKSNVRPNTLIMGEQAWLALQDNAAFKGMIQYGTPDKPSIVSPDLVKNFLNIDRIFISRALFNNGGEGAASDTKSIVGNNVLAVYASPTPGIMTPSAGYTFEWDAFNNGGSQGVSIEPVPNTKSDRYELEACYDQKIVAKDMGALLTNVVA